jgi:hypothetical protein
MRASRVLLPILALAAALASWSEDRTERIDDPKEPRDLVYRNDLLVEERSYDLRGAIVRERFFDASALPYETRRYLREGGRLLRVEAEDAAGNLEGSLSYRYDRGGRLLGVSAMGSLGLGSAGMISLGGIPQGSWVAEPIGPKTTVQGYDEAGRATVILSMLEGEAVAVEKRSYGESGLLISVSTEDRIAGSSSETLYDGKGRATARMDKPAKGLPSKTEYRYDDADRLVEELTYTGGHRSSRSIDYAADGSKTREETRRDGELLLVVTYIENGRVEELYEDGSVFVKATYIGGRKVKDEFYLDGVAVRTREYS